MSTQKFKRSQSIIPTYDRLFGRPPIVKQPPGTFLVKGRTFRSSVNVIRDLNSPRNLSPRIPSPDESKFINVRSDRFGTAIVKNGKDHRVSFRDEVTKNGVDDVYLVKCYRKYNEPYEISTVSCCTCSCTVF